ncbi:MAG: hypothetical protein QNJ31_06315 [Candidatus Caenarcaniphilales bacterium]|nr:hypothetical protein [Candidatus Caenarcaniphilales bacterium]
MQIQPITLQLNSSIKSAIKRDLESHEDLETIIAGNPTLSRAGIEIGEDIAAALMSLTLGRSGYYIVESVMATAFWLIVGFLLPTVLQKKLIVPEITKYLKSKYKITNNKPIETPFAHLDKGFLKKENNLKNLSDSLGFKGSRKKLRSLANSIFKGKMFIMVLDYLFLWLCTQTFLRFRNWWTEKASGKEGYSGEFTYATEEYSKAKAEELKSSESLRHKLATVVGLLGNLSIALLCGLTLKSTSPIGKGLFGNLKKLTPAIEYHEGIYMSKWLLMFQTIFNYNLGAIFFFIRSINEMRDSLLKMLTFDFLFYIGDDLFGGIAANYFEKKHKNKLQGIQLTQEGFAGFKTAKPLHKIVKEIQQKQLSSSVKEIAEKLARTNFRIGIGVSAFLLGLMVTTINVLSTKAAIKKEGGERKEDELRTQNNFVFDTNISRI